MNPTRGETDPSRNPVPSEHHGGDGAATGGHDSPVLTPVEDLVEQFGPPSVSLEDMLQVALDPSTPDPGDELIPDNDSVHDSASDAGADAGGELPVWRNSLEELNDHRRDGSSLGRD